jgi:hypothetical protein
VGVRIALLLGATPVGTMRREILYLRSETFRPLLQLILAVLVLEAFQMELPLAADVAGLGTPTVLFINLAVDVFQAVLLLVLALGTFLAFRPYSRQSLAELEVVARRSIEALVRRLARQQPRGRARRGS